MQRCLYCPTVFEEAKREHIIHAFLGARWKDGTLICDDCQAAFADGIDVALAERLQPIRILLGTEGDHGGTGQPIKGLPVTSGETVDLGAGGQPRLSKPTVKLTERPDGGHDVQIKIPREKDLGWALKEVRDALPHAKLDMEQIRKLGEKKRERLDGEVTIDVGFGGLDFFRGLLKSCCNLFAAHAPAARAAFLEPAFDAVRAFVKDGTGTMSDFVRWLPDPAPLALPRRGPIDQAVFLTTRGGSVEGVAQFFGELACAVRLTTTYAGPPIRCAYIVDPYRQADPAEQRLAGEELIPFDDAIPVFAEQSAGNTPQVQAAWRARLDRIMAHYAERENEEVVWQVVNQTVGEGASEDVRQALAEKVRELIRKRFRRFEETGDGTGITVVGTR